MKRQHQITVASDQPDRVVPIRRQGLHLTEREFTQQWRDYWCQAASADDGRQLLWWDAVGVGDLSRQQKPAQHGVGDVYAQTADCGA